MRQTRWDWIGGGAGAALGLADALALPAFGADLRFGDRDATLLVVGLVSAGFAGLGFAWGRLAMARAAARDASETIRRQLRELEQAQARVVQQEKLAALGRVAAGIAHEVRNPLGVIRASASMVEEHFDPESDSQRACRFIVEEIDRLNALIGALLAFAKPAALRVSDVSLEKVVDRALHLAATPLRERGIDVVRETIGSSDVRADPDLLAQVVYGLVLNAVERTPEAGRLELRMLGDASGARLEVADSGPGVEPELVDQIFEPFFTTKPDGTGLGLAVAERIVEAHGGRLEHVPAAGAGDGRSGACFRVALPGSGTRGPGPA